MTIKREARQVHRDVNVVTCNRCGAESTEEGIGDWMHTCRLEARQVPNPFGVLEMAMCAKRGTEQHYCPPCAQLIDTVTGDKPAPHLVGGQLANIAVKTTTGETVMLTRYEYDRWAASGQPPILSSLKVKS